MAAGSSDDLRISRADFSDREAVLSIIEDINSGLDYMPTLFYHFLHAGCVIYVAEDPTGKLVYNAPFSISAMHGLFSSNVCRQSRHALSYRSTVISISGLLAAMLNVGSRTTSENVGSAIDETSIVENIGVTVVAIASLPVYISSFKSLIYFRFTFVIFSFDSKQSRYHQQYLMHRHHGMCMYK